jgi:hypothetical protein
MVILEFQLDPGGLVMEARSGVMARRLAALNIVVVGVITGVVAGVILALTQMIYGWASSAHSAWDAPMAIWAWLAGLNYFGRPGDHVWPIVLGLGGHMVNSVVAGVIFVALLGALRLRNDLWAIVLGVAYGLALWAIMRYGILPLRDSTKALFTTSMVSPQWVWWLAHGLFGLTAGIVYVAARRVQRMRVRMQPAREEEHRAAA